MRDFLITIAIIILSSLAIFGQVSKSNSTQGSITGGAAGHFDKTFVYTAGDFADCTNLSKVDISIHLKLGVGSVPKLKNCLCSMNMDWNKTYYLQMNL